VARLELQETAYGAAIRQEIHARSGRDVSINAVYTTLDRLETKGFLKSWVGAPTPQRGGRRRKFYAMRPSGVAALRQAYRALTAMADGLKRSELPRLAIWLLTRRLSAEWCEFVVGDLEDAAS
jgi:DNA-binding PadR family transcriptional regulator